MAAIDGINGMRAEDTTEQMGTITQSTAMVVDEKTKELQSQIQGKQLELQRLSTNETMAEEEKMQKRQELLKQVSSLNTELRQHQLDMQREKNSKTDQDASSRKKNSVATDDSIMDENALPMSAQGMQSIISADTAIKQAVSHGSVVTALEGRSRVLESEITLDAGRGASTEQKERELENISYAVTSATASRLGIVGTANVRLNEAMEKEQQEKKNEQKERKWELHGVRNAVTTPGLAKNEQNKSATAGQHPLLKNTTSKLYSSTGRTLAESMGFSVSIKG